MSGKASGAGCKGALVSLSKYCKITTGAREKEKKMVTESHGTQFFFVTTRFVERGALIFKIRFAMTANPGFT